MQRRRAQNREASARFRARGKARDQELLALKNEVSRLESRNKDLKVRAPAAQSAAPEAKQGCTVRAAGSTGQVCRLAPLQADASFLACTVRRRECLG